MPESKSSFSNKTINELVGRYIRTIASLKRDQIIILRSKIAKYFASSDEKQIVDIRDILELESEILKKNKVFLPTLSETITNTDIIRKIISDVTREFSENNLTVSLGGSARWGQYYSLNKNSDIDFDIIFDSPLCTFLNDKKLEMDFNAYYENYNRGLVDILISKMMVSGKEVSFHLFPKKEIEKIFSLNYQQARENYVLRAYRTMVSEKLTPSYGPTFNFFGDPYYFPLNTRKLANGFVTDQPFVMIGSRGEFILGPSLHKLIVLTAVSGQESDFIGNGVRHVIEEVLKRTRQDEEKLHRRGSIVKLVAKTDRMPLHYQKDIERLDVL